jgi:hypothetical protein
MHRNLMSSGFLGVRLKVTGGVGPWWYDSVKEGATIRGSSIYSDFTMRQSSRGRPFRIRPRLHNVTVESWQAFSDTT